MFTLPVAVMLFAAPCADVAACQKQCDAKNGVSCVAWARSLKDDARVFGLYGKACELGAGEGCRLAAFSFVHGLNGQKKDFAKSTPYFDRGCTAKDAMSCQALAEAYKKGIGVEQNKLRAAETHQKACDLGELQDCASAGVMWERGDGVNVDLAKAQALYTRACTKEIVTGCMGLAMSSTDPVKAHPLLVQSCEGGIGSACAELSLRVTKGTGTRADRALGMSYARRACDLDQMTGCNNLGAALMQDKDLAGALLAYQKACAQNYEGACNAVGVLQLSSKSPVRDPAAGAKALKVGCTAGDTDACENLAMFCKKGEKAACP